MGNSSSRRSDSRPTREIEIEREYEKQKMKIQSIKRANVDELKDALNEVNSKNRELSETKWNMERLNAQLDSTNRLNLQLNQQISSTMQKYNNAVLIFSGMVCLAAVLFLWVLMQRRDSPSAVVNDAMYTTVSQSHVPDRSMTSFTDYTEDSAHVRSSGSGVLMVSSASLFATLQQHSAWCTSSDSTCSADSFESLWQALSEQHVPVSYSTLLTLVTRVFAPSLSLGLVAACVGVLFATLAASFSVLFFWKSWDGPTQLLTALMYMFGFTSAGVYMHQTAKDPALQIPGGTLVALGCCAVYLVVLALFKTAHATGENGAGEKRHKEYREDPMFRFVAVLAVGAGASLCLRVIPFAPLGVVIVSAGGWFVIFTIALLLADVASSDDAAEIAVMGGGVLGYALGIWVVFNPHAGLVSVYSLFPQQVNEAYPLVTDVALWMEWSACLWGLAAVVGTACCFLTKGSFSSSRNGTSKHETVITVSIMVYIMSLGTLYVGVRVESLAVSVVGHLGVLFFNCISLPAPMPLLAMAHAGLVLASGVWQAQAVALVGPLETLSSVVLGPLGVCMLTLYASGIASGNGKSLSLPLQALVMNLALLGWGTYVSRTLMFLAGLVGIAVFVIHLGLTFMKGSASFVLLLVLLSFVVATVGILSQ